MFRADHIYNSVHTILISLITLLTSPRGYQSLLDVRDAGQFAKEHIPGAVNIEWRKVFAERASLPKDQLILAYCNTGSFAAQSAMALRLAGFENVRLLHGGFVAWKAATAAAAK